MHILQEMLAVGIMKTKKKTVQRVQMWDKIAENLCSYDEPKFHVTKRGVRDRYTTIAENYRERCVRRRSHWVFRLNNLK